MHAGGGAGPAGHTLYPMGDFSLENFSRASHSPIAARALIFSHQNLQNRCPSLRGRGGGRLAQGLGGGGGGEET